MAATNPYVYCDISTLTNFKAWAQTISTFIGTTAGWAQSTDTGQVNWSTIASVPGTNSYVYEIWQPNDGGTNFYLRLEYGNNNGQPGFRSSIGTSTNGAGTLTGYTMGPFISDGSYPGYTSNILMPCWLSGAPGRLCLYMWDTNALGFVMSVERSINNSGVYTNSHVTLIQTEVGTCPNMQSILFGVGTCPAAVVAGTGGLPAKIFAPTNNGGIFHINPIWLNQWGFDLCAPYVGYWDNQLTNVGVSPNWVYGTYQTTVYGATRTYYISNSQGSGLTNAQLNTGNYLVVRHD